MAWVIKANRWFDAQPETKRFLIFIIAICVPLGFIAAFAPITYLAVALILGGQRLWWLKIGSRS